MSQELTTSFFFFSQLNISSLPNNKTRTQYTVLLINKPLSSIRET